MPTTATPAAPAPAQSGQAPVTTGAAPTAAPKPLPHPGTLADGSLATEKSPVNQSDTDLMARYGITRPDDEGVQAGAEGAESPEEFDQLRETTGDDGAEAEAVGEPETTDGNKGTGEAKASEQPPLATEFVLKDAQGELEIPRDLVIEFAAGKRQYALPLDRVVRMAQSGARAHDVEQENTQLRDQAQRLPAVEEQLRAYVTELESEQALFEQLLENEDLYIEAARRFRAENTPEKRAERERVKLEQDRTALQQERARIEREHQMHTVVQAVQSQIVPRIQAISEHYKDVVEWEEIRGQWYYLTQPLLAADGNGGAAIPPTRLHEAVALTDQLETWANALAEKRVQSRRAREASTRKAVQQVQHRAVAAKRQLARAAAPALSHAPTVATDQPREKPVKTTRDAVERIVERTERKIRERAASG